MLFFSSFSSSEVVIFYLMPVPARSTTALLITQSITNSGGNSYILHPVSTPDFTWKHTICFAVHHYTYAVFKGLVIVYEAQLRQGLEFYSMQLPEICFVVLLPFLNQLVPSSPEHPSQQQPP